MYDKLIKLVSKWHHYFNIGNFPYLSINIKGLGEYRQTHNTTISNKSNNIKILCEYFVAISNRMTYYNKIFDNFQKQKRLFLIIN